MNQNLPIKIKNTILKTPFIFGSCDLIGNYEQASKIVEIANGNLGAITWKTTTLEPRQGYKEPIICDFNDGFLVASGMKNIGIDQTIKEVIKFKENYPNEILIISIASTDPKKYVRELVTIVKKLKKVNIDGIELNLSCPHQVSNERYKTELIAQDEKAVGLIVKKISKIIKKTSKMLIVKLTGWNANLPVIAKASEKYGADAIIVSNIFPGIGYYTGLEQYHNEHDYKIGDALVGNFKGGYTGVSLLPAILLMINEVKQSVKIPVLATGGCMSSDDAIIQALFAGASAIVSSTFYYDVNCHESRDFGIDLEAKKQMLIEYMNKNNISNIDSFYLK